MATYKLTGEAYLSDGVYGTEVITTGSLKHCNEVEKALRESGQYTDMQVVKPKTNECHVCESGNLRTAEKCRLCGAELIKEACD